MREYIQSTEEYKGFILKIRMFMFVDLGYKSTGWHRECLIYRGDERIAISKTKKAAKDLIDHGCYDRYIKDGQ